MRMQWREIQTSITKIVKLGESNKIAYEDLILSINTTFFVGKVAFGLVTNSKSEHFLEGNSKIAWDRLVSEYVPHTALSLLKLKSEFHNSKLQSMKKVPKEWILHLEGLQIQMKIV